MSYANLTVRFPPRKILPWAFLISCALPLSIASCPSGSQTLLKTRLSSDACVTRTIPPEAERWSQFAAPQPVLYVLVGEESDVAETVKFANQYNQSFLVQNGGNGWADTFNLGGQRCGILIDISPLNQVSFNQERTQASVQGGASVTNVIDAAQRNNARIATATCNCLGFFGSALGGGRTRLSGLYGLVVDQLVSANVVLSSGDTVRVSPTDHSDLWWALGGAGPNFGIVTSATVKSYPLSKTTQSTAWTGTYTFPDVKLGALMEAISELDLGSNGAVDILFLTTGAPNFTPLIQVVPLFLGNTSAAEAVFAPLLQVGPTSGNATQLPFNEWNSGHDPFCEKGGRKPSYSAFLARINTATWVEVYAEFKKFVASNPAAFGGSSIVTEKYPTSKSLQIGNRTSSYPFRHLPYTAVVTAQYSNASLDSQATAFGAKLRSMWWATAGTTANSTYVNFGHGDETLSTIYGESLPRLQRLKKQYDPLNRFNQWFSLA